MTLTGNDLKKIGFIEGRALGLALKLLIKKEYYVLTKEAKLSLLKQILDNPSSFIRDSKLSALATELRKPANDPVALNIEGKSYEIYGAEAMR